MMLHPQIAHHILAPLGLPVAATEQEIPGNGIGLYIIKSIVEKLGGKLNIQSHLDQGTTISVWFPIAQG